MVKAAGIVYCVHAVECWMETRERRSAESVESRGGNCRVSSVHVSTREKVLLCVEKKVSLPKRFHFIVAYTKAGPQSNR